jgi:histidinol-phosphate/aromatic aminotransferase/cobyric acid decarboxylase-like protein
MTYRMRPPRDIVSGRGCITEKTKLIWLNNPNNPTGLILPPKRIEEFIRNLPEGTWTVLDEAYGEFALKGSLPVYRRRRFSSLFQRERFLFQP